MPAEARREQLLDVTKAIVAERGFHAVSIEGVAREAGISRPIVYGHFDDLPGLLDALVRARGRPRARPARGGAAGRRSRRAPRRSGSRAALGGYLEAVRADPATWRLVLVPHEGAPAVLHEAISRGRAAVVAQLAAALGGERGLRVARPGAGRAPALRPGRRGRPAAARRPGPLSARARARAGPLVPRPDGSGGLPRV